ncbi:hypothetical protein ACP70R_041993 [Stipagrostis hirtigluma subsp. patula]
MQRPSKISSAASASSTKISVVCEFQGWADLPQDLLQSIIALLGSLLDILAFAGTCRSWRAAFSSYPSKSTLCALLPPLIVRPDVRVRAPRRSKSKRDGRKLRTCKVIDPASPNTALRCRIPQETLRKWHFVGSSYGQLICGRHGDCLIVDVFTGARVSPPHLPLSLETEFNCGMLTAPLTSPGSHLLVCAQSSSSSIQSSLLDWPVGSDSWSELRLDNARIHQIVDFNGQIIAMDISFKLYNLSLAPRLGLQEIKIEWCGDMREWQLMWPWLVVCGDMLLIVDPYIRWISFEANVNYKPYHLDLSTKPATCVEMPNLENYALFIGGDVRSSTFSCMSPGRWCGRSNCLYYGDYSQPWSLRGVGDDVDGMWDHSDDCDLVFRRTFFPICRRSGCTQACSTLTASDRCAAAASAATACCSIRFS